jgi:hypothetical protein
MKLKLSILPFIILLAACQSLGVPPADTFNKRIVVANSLVESASATVETLFTAGKLSQPDAKQFNQRCADAAAGIDITRQTHVTDPTAADAKLTAIIAGLNALNAELQNRKGE